MNTALKCIMLVSLVGSAVSNKGRTKRQINFGGGGGGFSSSSDSASVSFDDTQKEVSNLKDFLQQNGDGQENNDVSTRFNFGQGNSKRYGASCTTPTRDPGSCRYITDREC